MAGTVTHCPLMGGVPLLQVTNVVFVCGWDHDSLSPYGRCLLTATYKCSVCVWLGPWLIVPLWEVSPYCRLQMKCLCVAGTVTHCPLMGGVSLLQVTNVVFVCGWDRDSLSPYGRCLLTAGNKCSVCVWLGPWLIVPLWEVSPYCRLQM